MDYRKDYYQLLEVSASASKEEIRAAYRRLAKLYHPDKNTADASAEEKFKQINEANEILSNDFLRQEYDAYRKEQEKWAEIKAKKETVNEEIKQANKNSYTRTQIVTTETRTYIKGIITVKYWAATEQRLATGIDKELDYKITPTEASIVIQKQDIHSAQKIPLDYLRALKESDIFSVPISQPIRCEVATELGKEYYELTLNDIRIKNIRLDGITKHENYSYGTLTGNIYGYSPKFTYEEKEETVTECFGETGRTEHKEENGIGYVRKEYYHPDCSTYWGNWIPVPQTRAYTSANRSAKQTPHIVTQPATTGCGIYVWLFALLSLLYLAPQFFIVCLVLAGLGILVYYGGAIFSSVSRILSAVGLGLLLLFLIAAVRSITGSQKTYVKKKTNHASVKTTRSARQQTTSADSAGSSPDTLITHHLKWQDYSGKSYEGSISVSVLALRNASNLHSRMSGNFYTEMSDIYKTMLINDSSQLFYLYKTFDSIKMSNRLDEIAFSQVLISAIQSLPYFLVLDRGCNENYQDDFTRNYLATCKTDCCIGNELFGVRTPIEFLSDLKGDCDTRSLLLYLVLKRYNYNVALLTSNYYKHALIAVNFTNEVSRQGLNITIDDKIYYLWETTSSDLNYGEVSSSFNNLSYWNISLLNKKI
ncbi:DnaJ-like protein [Lacibacter cauensis]|uniref:DnaJ-like protein n=1 Tax=Lacibacter cauensis TaxID=510947 RepID=A0A562S9F0_9BACT|nr:DnaJ domain-containing protein [Lacibacter cauensis]TWI78007.1 DnaJ-like protein [Lacibacter cauensis]